MEPGCLPLWLVSVATLPMYPGLSAIPTAWSSSLSPSPHRKEGLINNFFLIEILYKNISVKSNPRTQGMFKSSGNNSTLGFGGICEGHGVPRMGGTTRGGTAQADLVTLVPHAWARPSPLICSGTYATRKMAPKSLRVSSSEIRVGTFRHNLLPTHWVLPAPTPLPQPGALWRFLSLSRGSFARKEKPGGEGARPGHRFLQGSSKCSWQSPNATSRPTAPLWLGPRRVIGTTKLFWGGMQDLRDTPTPLGRHRLAPALPYVPGGGQSSVTRHVGGTGTRDTCAWFHAPTVCLSPLPCLDRWSGRLVLAAPPHGLWAPLGCRTRLQGHHSCLGFSIRCCSHSASTTL